MNRLEAENFVYKSYLKAEKYQNYTDRDSRKRNPSFSKKIIKDRQGTPCVVVTGSKGKGSVACMISQIMQTKKNVGLMTSPHLINFCERFKINGKDISDSDFVKHMEVIAPLFSSIDNHINKNEFISPMGIQAALALDYFNKKNTDFNIFECGKGAKYDDVNNQIHAYSVINTIFLEHTRELGSTLTEIAEDKSHVITDNQKCAYIAKQTPEVLDIIKMRADKKNVQLKIYGKDFWAENIEYTNSGMIFDVVIQGQKFRNIAIPLLGQHQAQNCSLALALCRDVLANNFDFNIVKEKLSQINWPGRMEVLSSTPFILLDACINGESCINVKNVLKQLQIEKITCIIGIPDDKDYFGVAKNMSDISQNIILTKSQNTHYIFTKKQMEILHQNGILSERTLNIKDAFLLARKYNLPTVILGTTSLISEVKKYFT